MSYFKQIAKKIPILRQWRHPLHFITGISVRLYVQALSLLPTQAAVSVKENIRRIGKLDYAPGNILMNLDSSKQLLRLGACRKEPETVEWIKTHIKSGDTLYDIGANVGAYSFVAYLVAGGDCTIYAFEPSFSTFAALSQNVILNGCHGKIVPLHLALFSETKLLTFNYASVTPGAALHSLSKSTSENTKVFQAALTQPIPSYRLDDLILHFALRQPNHIKLDVDGAELDVLCGADQTLSHPGLRSILIEVDDKDDPSGKTIRFIENKGFHIRSRHPRGNSETLANYIFERQ